ncbi:MAG: SRPBCC family protein [Verrucomicrobiota bacterium]
MVRVALPFIFLSFVGLSSGVFASSAKIKPTWSKAVISELSKGQVVTFDPKTESRGGHLAGAIHVSSSSGEVWKLITNAKSMPRYLRNLRKSVSVKRTSKMQIISHEVKMAFLPMTVKYTYQANYSRQRNIHFTMIDGDLREFEGYWQLIDAKDLGLGSGTVVFYQIYVDPGGIVPSSLVRQNIRKDLPNMLIKLKSCLEGGAKVAMNR